MKSLLSQKLENKIDLAKVTVSWWAVDPEDQPRKKFRVRKTKEQEEQHQNPQQKQISVTANKSRR